MKIKFSNNNAPIYTKIYSYLTITIVITIIVASSIFYISFEKIGLQLIYTSTRDGLSQISYSAKVMNDSAKTLCLQIYFDSIVSKLLRTAPPDMEDSNAGLDRLGVYHSIIPYIHSIYIYNGRTQTVYSDLANASNQRVQDTKNFFDIDLKDILKMNEQLPILIPIPRNISVPLPGFNETHKDGVYTYIFKENSSSPSSISNAVILNLSDAWIRQMINSLDISRDSNTIIIDSQGKLISGNKKDSFLTDISDKTYIKKVLTSKENSGYFTETIDGSQSLVSYVTSDNVDWKFVRVTPYANVKTKINKMKDISILISLFILVLGFTVSLITSKKLYLPINTIISRVKSLEDDKKSNYVTLKQEFLRNLIQNENILAIEKTQQLMDSFAINLKSVGNFIIVLLKIDNYVNFKEKYTLEDRGLLKYGIVNIANEISAPFFPNECVDTGDKYLSIIINIEPSYADDNYDRVVQLVQDIQHTTQQMLQVSLSASISSIGNDLCDISYLYQQALDNSRYHVFQGSKSITLAKNIDAFKAKHYVYPIEKERLLVNALVIGKMEEAKTLYSELIASTIEYSINVYTSTLLRISLAISTAMETMEKEADFSFSYNFSEFIAKLNDLESLEQINNAFYELFAQMAERMDDRKLKRHDDMLARIIGMIQNDYTNPNLTIYTICDTINMSPVYLGRLFKKLTNKSVSTYINDVRMEKAKELLLKTSSSVNDIAVHTGFANSNYFFTLFKKINGITPNEFRQINSNKNE